MAKLSHAKKMKWRKHQDTKHRWNTKYTNTRKNHNTHLVYPVALCLTRVTGLLLCQVVWWLEEKPNVWELDGVSIFRGKIKLNSPCPQPLPLSCLRPMLLKLSFASHILSTGQVLSLPREQAKGGWLLHDSTKNTKSEHQNTNIRKITMLLTEDQWLLICSNSSDHSAAWSDVCWLK